MRSRNCIIAIIIIIIIGISCSGGDASKLPGFGCCWCSGDTPQSSDCGSSCNVQGNMGAGGGGMEGDSGILMEDVCDMTCEI